MEKIISILTAPATRMWCYNVMIAIMTVLTVRGVINSDDAAAFTALGAAFFAIASANTPRPEKRYDGKHEA